MGLQPHKRRCAALIPQGTPGSVMLLGSTGTDDSPVEALVLAPPVTASAATETSSLPSTSS